MPLFVLGQFTGFVAWMLDSLLSAYFWILLISVLLTYVNPDPRNPIVRFLRGATEPVLYQVRRFLPFVYTSGLDFSPVVVIIAITFAQRVVVGSLYQLALRIGAAGAV
jgi:YggT family protein